MSTDSRDDQEERPTFDVDGMLGRLAKWLRILGFDAEYPIKAPRKGRIFVSTRGSCSGSSIVRVVSNDPVEQIREVLEETGVRPDPDLFLGRCLVCNVSVREVSTDEVAQRIPALVLDLHEVFHQCPTCGRIYWEGTHAERMKRRLDAGGISVP